ncbi:hypothetical protein IWQ61_008991 [Dispira simplex]|nr:hypothetical protein IWQ61_008991 [Dispira simplex]
MDLISLGGAIAWGSVLGYTSFRARINEAKEYERDLERKKQQQQLSSLSQPPNETPQ